jgi:hypothetical protein
MKQQYRIQMAPKKAPPNKSPAPRRRGFGGSDLRTALQRRRYRGCPTVLSRQRAVHGRRVPVMLWYASANSTALLDPPSEKACTRMLELLWYDNTRSMAGRSLVCLAFEDRTQMSFVVVVMTMMGVVGKRVWYVIVYLATCRPWAPVQGKRTIREGASLARFHVRIPKGRVGMYSHIVGATGVKPGMASCRALEVMVK